MRAAFLLSGVIHKTSFDVHTNISLRILFQVEIFVQLAFNLSNRVTDTLESSTILIYSKSQLGLNTQMVGRMPR